LCVPVTRLPSKRHAFFLASALLASLPACGKKSGSSSGAAAGSGTAAASAQPLASAEPAPLPLIDTSFAGVSQWQTAETLPECAVKTRDLEQNLSYGGIAMAGSGNSFAFTWHLSTGNKVEGLVAFSGYDSMTRTLGPSHGLGKGILYEPQVYPSGDSWLVVWFDPATLVFTRTTWAPTLPDLSRVGALSTASRDDTAISGVPDGSLAAASSFEVGGKRQLGIFTFAPIDPNAEPVHAVGAVKGAEDPRLPALTVVEGGFVVAWLDKGGRVMVGQMNTAGKEVAPPMVVSHGDAGVGRPALAASKGIVYVSWTEKDKNGTSVFVRAFDPKAPPAPSGFRVEAGYAPTLIATETGALLSFLRKGEGGPDILGVAVERGGKPASKGVVLVASTNRKATADLPHAAALAADGRLGIGWTDTNERRARMKTVLASCLGLGAAPAPAASASGSAAPAPAPSP
jgi:hypothetical protein